MRNHIGVIMRLDNIIENTAQPHNAPAQIRGFQLECLNDIVIGLDETVVVLALQIKTFKIVLSHIFIISFFQDLIL